MSCRVMVGTIRIGTVSDSSSLVACSQYRNRSCAMVKEFPGGGKTTLETWLAVALVLLGKTLVLACQTNAATDVSVRKVVEFIDELRQTVPAVDVLTARNIRVHSSAREDRLSREFQADMYPTSRLRIWCCEGARDVI
jgi:hypothetical protein